MIKILLVDDQAAVRRGLRMQLSLENTLFVVGEAENGLRALEVIHELNPDLIILDLEMPIMDGHRTLKELRKQHSDIPVIMLSIHDSVEDRTLAEAEGVSEFVVKSGDLSPLITAIYKAIDQNK